MNESNKQNKATLFQKIPLIISVSIICIILLYSLASGLYYLIKDITNSNFDISILDTKTNEGITQVNKIYYQQLFTIQVKNNKNSQKNFYASKLCINFTNKMNKEIALQFELYDETQNTNLQSGIAKEFLICSQLFYSNDSLTYDKNTNFTMTYEGEYLKNFRLS